MSVLDKSMRRFFKGVSWQSNYVKPVIYALDAPDWILRQASGRHYLPKYSARVRSDGVTRQLGGNRFDYFGGFTAQLLAKLTDLSPASKVLEIGCGCGRTALALTKMLDESNYTGVDIDRPSIQACLGNQRLQDSQFNFKHIDVHNPMYNPEGKQDSTTYKFPFEDGSVDVIFLISVFTHMLPEEVTHYIREISRMLAPGGKCFVSTFLMDYGHEGKIVSFPYEYAGVTAPAASLENECRVHVETIPEKAVGYSGSFFDKSFAAVDMRSLKRVLGDWRLSLARVPDGESVVEFGQDVLVFEKDLLS